MTVVVRVCFAQSIQHVLHLECYNKLLAHHWQHKSLVVVGVLPDKVHSSWSANRDGGKLIPTKLLAVQTASL